MFDTMMIAKCIKQARIDQNMTQMALADALGVSYQAVSNWERGNSMPDISKLGNLCAALNITVNELLGLEDAAPNPVKKAMNQEELTMEELAEVAPVMLPEDVKVRMEGQCLHVSVAGVDVHIPQSTEGDSSPNVRVFTCKKSECESAESIQKSKKLDLSRIADMAPYLDQKYLDELIKDVDLSDLDGLEDVAPFLSMQTLDSIVERAAGDLETLAEVAPFLSNSTLEKLVSRCDEARDFSTLEELAPFVSETILDRLAENVQPDNFWEIASIAPFFGQQTLDKLVRRCEDAENFDALEEIAPFVSDQVLNDLIDRYIEKGSDADLSDIYPFLIDEALGKLDKHMMEQKDLDALEDLMPFV